MPSKIEVSQVLIINKLSNEGPVAAAERISRKIGHSAHQDVKKQPYNHFACSIQPVATAYVP
jgi:hypothetical protein